MLKDSSCDVFTADLHVTLSKFLNPFECFPGGLVSYFQHHHLDIIFLRSLWIAGPVEGSGDQFHQVRELVLPIG